MWPCVDISIIPKVYILLVRLSAPIISKGSLKHLQIDWTLRPRFSQNVVSPETLSRTWDAGTMENMEFVFN